jgi:hypothetical protein
VIKQRCELQNQVFRYNDVNLDILKDKVIAVLGYGIQGGPQALCMRAIVDLMLLLGLVLATGILIGTRLSRMVLR